MKKKLTKTLLAACSAALFIFAGTVGATSFADDVNSEEEWSIWYEYAQPIDELHHARVVAINGRPVSQQVAQGGIAEGGQCAGLCGGDFPDPCGGPEDPVCECACDQLCFLFDDCCDDVCKDCPTLVGCEENTVIDTMYFHPGGFAPHPAGFIWCCVGVAHGETVVADPILMWSGGKVVAVQLSMLNAAGAGTGSNLELARFQLVFYDMDIGGSTVQSAANPPVGAGQFYLELSGDPPPVAVPAPGSVPVATIDLELELFPEGHSGSTEPGLQPGFILTAILVQFPPDEFIELPKNVWAGMRFKSDTVFANPDSPLGNLGQQVKYTPTFGGTFDRIWVDEPGTAALAPGLQPHLTALALGLIPPGLPNSSLPYAIVGAVDYIGACAIAGIPEEPDCPGDLIGPPGDPAPDGVVNGFDLNKMLSCWGPVVPGCEAADLTGPPANPVPDGVVNGFDLQVLLSAWGPCPAPALAGDEEIPCALLTRSECEGLPEGIFSSEEVGCQWPGLFVDPAGACCFNNAGCLSPTGAFPQTASECASRGLCCHGAPGTYTDCDPVGIVVSTDPLEVDWNTEANCLADGGNWYPGLFQGDYVLCGVAQCGCAGGTGCADGVNSLETCFCDAGCAANGDCCLDACGACGDENDPAWDFCLGCEGNCGSPFATIAGCFCDAACTVNEDCCPDFCDFCAEFIEDECPTCCAQGPQATCQGFCGLTAADIEDKTAVPHACSCHSGCDPEASAGDPNRCCLDVCTFCEAFVTHCPDLSTCGDTNSCGGFNAFGNCWCDPFCCNFGDCCLDKGIACGGCNPEDSDDCCPTDNSCVGDCGDCTTGVGEFFCCCDEACCALADCCEDKVAECGGCVPGVCDITCPTGANLEDEVCGTAANNTCANADTIACNSTTCGTVWLGEIPPANNRDFDWYRLVINDPMVAIICVAAEFTPQIRVQQQTGTLPCGGPVLLAPPPLVAIGQPSCVTHTFNPGTYHIIISPVSTVGAPSFECEDGCNEYYLSVECLDATQNCIGKCGSATGQDGLVCGCDVNCHDRGDCCLNACSECGDIIDNCQSCEFAINSSGDPVSPCGTEAVSTSPDGSCRCDEGCCPTQTCCTDKIDACGASEPNCDSDDFLSCNILDSEGNIIGSHCGQYGPVGCFCDPFCKIFDDCCQDYDALCLD